MVLLINTHNSITTPVLISIPAWRYQYHFWPPSSFLSTPVPPLTSSPSSNKPLYYVQFSLNNLSPSPPLIFLSRAARSKQQINTNIDPQEPNYNKWTPIFIFSAEPRNPSSNMINRRIHSQTRTHVHTPAQRTHPPRHNQHIHTTPHTFQHCISFFSTHSTLHTNIRTSTFTPTSSLLNNWRSQQHWHAHLHTCTGLLYPISAIRTIHHDLHNSFN